MSFNTILPCCYIYYELLPKAPVIIQQKRDSSLQTIPPVPQLLMKYAF